MEDIDVDWDDEAITHMLTSHGITVAEAEEALDDPDRVAQIPDLASRSGCSDRYIGWSTTRNELLVVIVVRDGTFSMAGIPGPRTPQRSASTTGGRTRDEQQDSRPGQGGA